MYRSSFSVTGRTPSSCLGLLVPANSSHRLRVGLRTIARRRRVGSRLRPPRSCALLRQEARETGADFSVLEAVVDGRFHIAELVPAIVAATLERIRQHAFFGQQAGDAVGQLDFAAGARLRGTQMMKDTGR